MTTLTVGSRGDAVRVLQKELQAAGFNPGTIDGQFGNDTAKAVRAYQTAHGLGVDGKAGTATMRALQNDAFEVAGSTPTTPSSPSTGAANTATFERVTGAGQRDQMVSGKLTVNGRTYQFNSGGNGNGNLPAGDYTVTPHLWSRNTPGMVVDGVGFSFALNNTYDSRVKMTRTELRIHPDGGSAGTHGCIGIVGNGALQKQFREDMRAELNRNGGSFTLHVG